MTSSSTLRPLVTSWVLVMPHPNPAQVYSVAVAAAVMAVAAVAAAAAAVGAVVASVAAVVAVALGAAEGDWSRAAVVKLPQRAASERFPVRR